MGTWTAQTTVAGLPGDVLAMLTEPEAIARWAPIGFDVMDFEGERLRAGDRVRVRGGLAGRRLEFDVEVSEAEDGYLALQASGPIQLDVEHIARASAGGRDVRAGASGAGRGRR